MIDNPYQATSDTNATKPNSGSPSYRGWLVILPIAWLCVLMSSGISSDFMRFSLPVAWGLTVGTVVALGILAYSVRGWWIIVVIPLWILLLMNVAVLWYWNV